MILHILLSIATLSTLSVDSESKHGFLTFSLPSPPQGVEYHNVEVWAAGSRLELSQLGPTKWQVRTLASSGTFTYVVCDDENCTPITKGWSISKSVGLRDGPLNVLSVVFLVAVCLLFIWHLWRHDLL
jgi:hypothetical protein